MWFEFEVGSENQLFGTRFAVLGFTILRASVRRLGLRAGGSKVLQVLYAGLRKICGYLF